jgi:flagellar basal-body rod modification protein FlgD
MATTIPGTTSSTASPGATASTAAATRDAADRFLTLLVSQLKNQDPLNPLDNAQVTTQLAQISTVSGINALNDTMSALAAAFDAKQYLQAASLVGRDVVVEGDQLSLAEGAALGGAHLASDADAVTVTIADATGKTVRTLDLGKNAAGLVTFPWDGTDASGATLKDGTYTIKVAATADGKAVTTTPLVIAEVQSLVPNATGGRLNLAGGGQVDLASVLQIN